jgi:hypothetical protein
MAIPHNEAVRLQQQIMDHFKLSGEHYLTVDLRPADALRLLPEPIPKVLILRVRISGNVSEQTTPISVALDVPVTLSVVKAMVRAMRTAWVQGVNEGRSLAIENAQSHIKDVLMGHFARSDAREEDRG